MNDTKGLLTIMSSKGNESSYELDTLQHSVFTYALLEGLKGAANTLPFDDFITIGELFQYIQKRTPELLQQNQLGQSQNPQIFPDAMSSAKKDLLKIPLSVIIK